MEVGVSGIARRTIRRANPDSVDGLRRLGVATIHEAMGRKGLMKPYVRPIYSGAYACATAITVLLHPEDNWMMHVAAEMLQPGDIVVASCSADCTDGFFGDLLATSFLARGAVGLVIDAGIRDIRDLTQMQFPVFSKSVCAKGTIKATVGSVNIPIICAGALILPGDVVVGDNDGVVVVPAAEAEATAEAAEKRERNENQKREKLASGTLGLDLYDKREALHKAGLKYVD
jgi:4-hydroxy-4-methyl-2-oxoglutarate aldolase